MGIWNPRYSSEVGAPRWAEGTDAYRSSLSLGRRSHYILTSVPTDVSSKTSCLFRFTGQSPDDLRDFIPSLRFRYVRPERLTSCRRLRSRLAKHSRNTSKPPCSDPSFMWPLACPSRYNSGRKPSSGQGHPDITLTVADVVRHTAVAPPCATVQPSSTSTSTNRTAHVIEASAVKGRNRPTSSISRGFKHS